MIGEKNIEKKAEKGAEVSDKMLVYISKIKNSNLPKEGKGGKDELIKEIA